MVYEEWDTAATRKVRYKSLDLKSVLGSVLKCVAKITKDGGGMGMNRLIDSV